MITTPGHICSLIEPRDSRPSHERVSLAKWNFPGFVDGGCLCAGTQKLKSRPPRCISILSEYGSLYGGASCCERDHSDRRTRAVQQISPESEGSRQTKTLSFCQNSKLCCRSASRSLVLGTDHSRGIGGPCRG
jgi:hypothetical protein